MRVEIGDGQQGWGTQHMTLCVVPNSVSPEQCQYLSESYGDIRKVVPITQEKVVEYAATKNR